MKKGDNSNFIFNDKKQLIGIDLGADFFSEHEHGIDGLKGQFSLKEYILKLFSKKKVYGIEKRKINNIPSSFVFKTIHIRKKEYFVLLCKYYNNENQYNDNYTKWLPNALIPYSNEQKLVCAWDNSSFGILASKDYKKEMETLYNAFMNKDIAIGFFNNDYIKCHGLAFMIISEINKEILDAIYEKDVYNDKLLKHQKNKNLK